jgi:cytochrome c oxidase subunit 2
MKPNHLLVPTFTLCVVALAAGAAQEPAVREIAIAAKKYEFTPNKVEIPLNTLVRFKITAQDNDHGFEIEGVKDSCIKIPKGETKTVDYKAAKAGPVTFKCCDFCGLGHGRMKGTITVK